MEEKVESVFKNKNYVLTFLGALVSNIAALLYSFAVSFYILKITNNNASMQGIYLAVTGVTFLIFSLFTGVLSDRFNKAKIMFLCDYARGATIIVTGLIILLLKDNDSAQLVSLFALGVIGNIIGAIFTPASQSLLPYIVQENQLQQGNSYFTMMNSFQSIVGILLAGILYSFLPFYLLLFIVGACYVGSGISEMFIKYKEDKIEEKLTVKVAFREMKESFIYLTSKGGLLIFIIIILFVNFFFNPINTNFFTYFIATDVSSNPNFLFHEFMKPEMWESVISICMCIGGIVGALVLSTRPQMEKVSKFLKITFLFVCLIVLSLPICYFTLVYKNQDVNPFLIYLNGSCLILGALISLINVPISTVIARVCDKTKLGKVESLINIGAQGLMPLGSFLAGLVITYWGSSVLLFICAGGFLVTFIFFLCSRKVNEL